MFDIDFIMNGKRKTKVKTKDPFSNIFPKSKPLMSLFKGQGHPNLFDKKTPQQKAFLKRTRIGTRNSHKRFIDHDGDGVISGLDCFPWDRKRHNSRWKQLVREGKDNVEHLHKTPEKEKIRFFKDEVLEYKRPFTHSPRLRDDSYREEQKAEKFRLMNMSEDEKDKWNKERSDRIQKEVESEDKYIDKHEKHWKRTFDEMEKFEDYRDESRTFNPDEARNPIDEDYQEYQEIKERQEPKVYKKYDYDNNEEDQ